MDTVKGSVCVYILYPKSFVLWFVRQRVEMLSLLAITMAGRNKALTIFGLRWRFIMGVSNPFIKKMS